MELKEYIEDPIINEALFNKYNVSLKAEKLINRLRTRLRELEFEIRKEDTAERREIIKAISKSIPIIEDFRDYFIKLEKQINTLSDKEKINEVEQRYEEIKLFFINELYQVMNAVGYKASVAIGSAITYLILAIVFVPGGGPVLFLPTVHLIRKINDSQRKVRSKKFSRELNKIKKELEKKKSLELKYV